MSRSLTDDDLSTSPRSSLCRPNNLGVVPFGGPFSEADVETAMEADEALTFEPGEEGPDASELGNEVVRNHKTSFNSFFNLWNTGLETPFKPKVFIFNLTLL